MYAEQVRDIYDQFFAGKFNDNLFQPVATIEELEKAMATAFYKHLDLRVKDGR